MNYKLNREWLRADKKQIVSVLTVTSIHKMV